MKFLLPLILLITALVGPMAKAETLKLQTPTTVTAGSPFSYTGYFDKHGLATVVTYKITTFTGLFGSPKYSIDLYSLAGIEAKDQAATAGFMLGKSGKIAANVSWLLGAGWTTVVGQKSGPGLCAGISGTF